MNYYYTDKSNQTQGPISVEQLQALVDAGRVNSNTMVVPVGGQQWSPIKTIIPSVGQGSVSNTETLAGWSFGLSLGGLLCCAFASIPAIVCGHISLSRFRDNPMLEGKGFAIAGLIIGYLNILLTIAAIVIFWSAFWLEINTLGFWR